jgi:Nitroreductase family
MRRRSDSALDARTFFAELSGLHLDWPGKTVRLERNSLIDYQQRPISPNVSVAEFYHENSKLYPNMASELAASKTAVGELRREFLRCRAAAPVQIPTEQGFDERAVSRLLTTVARTIDHELFYAVEIRAAVGDTLFWHEPVTDRLELLKRLSAEDRVSLRNALGLLHPADLLPEGPMVFLIGCFARNDVLFGPRGYRRTLLEAGQVTAALLAAAAQLGLEGAPIFEFTDRDVDAVMEADGIGDGTLAAIALGETGDVE